MAFLPQPQEDQENQAPDQNQIPLIPTLAGSGASDAPSSSGAATSAPAKPGEAPSAPWANIGSYLSNNQTQGKDTANKIAGNFSQSYQDIQNQAGQAEKNFTDQVNQNTVGFDQNLFNSATADPVAFSKDPNNVAAFQKAYNASYGGPNAFENTADYKDIQSKIQSGQKNAGLLSQGESGLQTLLQNTGRNGTPGQNALDTLLLQEDPNNYNTISSAAAPFSGLTDYLNGKVSSLNSAAKDAAATTGGTAQNLQNAFTGANGIVPNFQNGFNTRLADTQKTAADNAAKYKNDILNLNTNIGQQEARALSLDPSQWATTVGEIKGLGKSYQLDPFSLAGPDWSGGTIADLVNQYGTSPDLNPYITTQDPNAAINRDNFASDQDYAEAAALSQLTGQASFLDPNQAKIAGTYNPNLVGFNYSGANQDVHNKLTQADANVLKGVIGASTQPTKDAGFNEFIKDVFSRNQKSLNYSQQQLLANLLAGSTSTTPTTPTTPAVQPPQKGDTRGTPDASGKITQEYFDGTNWVKAPAEFTDYQSGVGYTQQFNYNTGKYEPIAKAKLPAAPGTTPVTGQPSAGQPGPGVFRAGGGSSFKGIY